MIQFSIHFWKFPLFVEPSTIQKLPHQPHRFFLILYVRFHFVFSLSLIFVTVFYCCVCIQCFSLDIFILFIFFSRFHKFSLSAHFLPVFSFFLFLHFLRVGGVLVNVYAANTAGWCSPLLFFYCVRAKIKKKWMKWVSVSCLLLWWEGRPPI